MLTYLILAFLILYIVRVCRKKSAHKQNIEIEQTVSPVSFEIEEVLEDSSGSPDACWCVVANLKKDISTGENQEELRSGTRLFRGGAKVYIIGIYAGLGESIVVIAQHRKSRKFLKCVIKGSYIENMRSKIIYSPKVLEIKNSAKDEGVNFITTESSAEEIIKSIASSSKSESERKGKYYSNI